MNRDDRSSSTLGRPEAAAQDAAPFAGKAPCANGSTLWERLTDVPELVDRWNFRLLV